MSQDRRDVAGRTPWDRSESRQVRPFRYASDYLTDASLRLYADGEFVTDDLVQTDEIDLERLAPIIRIPPPPDLFADLTGASATELRLVVIVEDPFWKRSTTVLALPLEKFRGGDLDLQFNVTEAASWRGETRLHVAVILDHDREAEIGYARRAGSWVAKKTFRVTRPLNAATFPIVAVDREWFIQQKLPSTTTYFVQLLADELDQPRAELPGLMKVCMSQELFSALVAAPTSATSVALMKSIYTDVVTTILVAGFGNLEGDPSPGSVLDTVINRLSRATTISRDRLMTYARDRSGAELRAVVQAEAELTRAMTGAARRRDV